eukprot:CAMPEP_0177260680 /NCGR_PEP_ID=MMETSP0367-20130122/59394_1 /TAXON_ID=447022 ORGANISM="Scrippsiella hangoei-like, Strain SHHI-4" /NCGR_SAMPLE_ID=MMETSP0367 /ASSEMBLY_ACC=CAM_ASM_000362 /LENGTH=58 /DNA_ID=CAMNT_0018715227 /DNA_START=96 /DNA_END=272 /DNA_ORIENTATION=-
MAAHACTGACAVTDRTCGLARQRAGRGGVLGFTGPHRHIDNTSSSCIAASTVLLGVVV